MATVPARVAADGDPWAAIDDQAQSITPLVDRYRADLANGIPDANLDSITAVVIGGTSLFGGRGGLIGSLLGAIIVGAFTLGLSLAGVDQQWRLFAIGVLVIVAVSVDQWIRKVKA